MGCGRGCAEGVELGGRRTAQYLRLRRSKHGRGVVVSRVNSYALTVHGQTLFENRKDARPLLNTEIHR